MRLAERILMGLQENQAQSYLPSLPGPITAFHLEVDTLITYQDAARNTCTVSEASVWRMKPGHTFSLGISAGRSLNRTDIGFGGAPSKPDLAIDDPE